MLCQLLIALVSDLLLACATGRDGVQMLPARKPQAPETQKCVSDRRSHDGQTVRRIRTILRRTTEPCSTRVKCQDWLTKHHTRNSANFFFNTIKNQEDKIIKVRDDHVK